LRGRPAPRRHALDSLLCRALALGHGVAHQLPQRRHAGGAGLAVASEPHADQRRAHTESARDLALTQPTLPHEAAQQDDFGVGAVILASVGRRRLAPLEMAQQVALRTAEELKNVVAWAAAEETPLEIQGAGSKRGYGRTVEAETRVALDGLSGIGLYEPAELVMSAKAGTPLAEIEDLLAENQQQLAFEAAGLMNRARLGAGCRRSAPVRDLRDIVICYSPADAPQSLTMAAAQTVPGRMARGDPGEHSGQQRAER
jgi:FAD binding domain